MRRRARSCASRGGAAVRSALFPAERSWIHLAGLHEADGSLRLERLQPVGDQRGYLLLKEYLLNAVGDAVERGRRCVLLLVFGQQRVVVVLLDLIGRDGDAGAEAELDELDDLHA